MNKAWVLTGVGVVAAGVLLYAVTRDGEGVPALSGYSLSGVPALPGQQNVKALSSAAQQAARIPGLSDFAQGVAYSESRFDNLANNTADSPLACEAYDATSWARASAYDKERWCGWGSGGYYGFLAVTGMKPDVFRTRDPLLVFDPAASQAMLADFVYRIWRNHLPKLPPEQRNFLAVRRSMKSLGLLTDWQESTQDAKNVRARFAQGLAASGLPESTMYRLVDASGYPGALTVWNAAYARMEALA